MSNDTNIASSSPNECRCDFILKDLKLDGRVGSLAGSQQLLHPRFNQFDYPNEDDFPMRAKADFDKYLCFS